MAQNTDKSNWKVGECGLCDSLFLGLCSVFYSCKLIMFADSPENRRWVHQSVMNTYNSFT